MLYEYFPQYLLLFRMPAFSLMRVDAMQRLVDDQGIVFYCYYLILCILHFVTLIVFLFSNIDIQYYFILILDQYIVLIERSPL